LIFWGCNVVWSSTSSTYRYPYLGDPIFISHLSRTSHLYLPRSWHSSLFYHIIKLIQLYASHYVAVSSVRLDSTNIPSSTAVRDQLSLPHQKNPIIYIQECSKLSLILTKKQVHCQTQTHRSICLWLYSPFVRPWSLFHFLNIYTVGRAPWTRDQPVARPLATHRTTQTE
jgi:hypothetical protein